MGGGDWRDQWEGDARTEAEALRRLRLPELLRRVRRGKLGDHYAIWDAIAAANDLRAAGRPLLEVVRTHPDYLHRYHAARALLTLLECTRYQPVDLAVARRDPAALADVERLLDEAEG